MRNIVTANPELEVAWYLRLANLVIDVIAIYVLFIIFILVALALTLIGVTDASGWMDSISDSGYDFIGVALIVFYYIIMEATIQRTIGKLITGTMVVTQNGDKPAFTAILGRSVCRIFTLELLSFIAGYPRGWHDSASGTYVVKAKKLKEVIALQNAFDQIGAPAEYDANRWEV